MQRRMIGAVTVLLLGSAAQAFAGQLALGRVTAKPGQPATVPITFRQGNGPVAVAVGTDITFDTKVLSNPRCAPGSAVGSGPGAKMATCSQPTPGVVRLAVLALNTVPLADGEVATLTFDVAPSTHRRILRLRQTPGGADANGTDFRLRSKNGSISVNTK